MSGAPPRIERLVVTAEDQDLRLDQFLTQRMPPLSRARVQQLIRDGRVRVKSGLIAKASLPVSSGLEIEVEVPPPIPAEPEPESLPLNILYDDADIVVVDKAAGMVVHPAAGHRGGTLVNALLHHVSGLSGIGGQERPGIVHRLDRGTSGVIVIAKHDAAHQALARQFQDRTAEKEYVAMAWGLVHPGLVIETPIGRDPRHRQKMSGRSRRGRAATSTVVDAEPLGAVTLVRVKIATGRTHQIRVHLSEAGHPVVGDALYGGVRRRAPAGLGAVNRVGRPFLHAAKLSVTHPSTGKRVSFEAPLPDDLDALLSTLRRRRPARS